MNDSLFRDSHSPHHIRTYETQQMWMMTVSPIYEDAYELVSCCGFFSSSFFKSNKSQRKTTKNETRQWHTEMEGETVSFLSIHIRHSLVYNREQSTLLKRLLLFVRSWINYFISWLNDHFSGCQHHSTTVILLQTMAILQTMEMWYAVSMLDCIRILIQRTPYDSYTVYKMVKKWRPFIVDCFFNILWSRLYSGKKLHYGWKEKESVAPTYWRKTSN